MKNDRDIKPSRVKTIIGGVVVLILIFMVGNLLIGGGSLIGFVLELMIVAVVMTGVYYLYKKIR